MFLIGCFPKMMANCMQRVTLTGLPSSFCLSPSQLMLKSCKGIHGGICFPESPRNRLPCLSSFRENHYRAQSMRREQRSVQIISTPFLPYLTPLPTRKFSKMNQADLPLEDIIFKILKVHDADEVSVNQLLGIIEETGIKLKDVRMEEFMRRLKEKQKLFESRTTGDAIINFTLNKDAFLHCVEPIVDLLSRVIRHDFVIPEWRNMTNTLTQIFERCTTIQDGNVAKYIPQLARVDPNLWGMSVCSIDGQRFSMGDYGKRFCLQSAQFPLAYSLALHENDGDYIHSYVGHEPSGLPVSSISLNKDKKPHNPMIHTGALVIASLLSQRFDCIADRFDNVISHNKKLCGDEYVGFDNATFLAERECGDRINAIGYILKEHKCFPQNRNVVEILDFYFQLCSIETDCNAGAVMAATLANSGVCPTTGEQVLNTNAVKDTLSLMYSCGMYDYSGQFAFRVGLPAKSSASGAILLVVPHVLGICLYSPALDRLGNSVRGIRFCEEFVNEFNFHNYDSLLFLQKKHDPRGKAYDQQARDVMSLLFSSYHNDVTALRREYLRGVNMEQADYDGRTALHIAAAEGHIDVIRFLTNSCKVKSDPLDRWGSTPLKEAERFGHEKVIDILRQL